MMTKAPAFQFYPNEWLSSPHIMLMTPAQEGAYIRLLSIAWNDPDCSIPDNDDELATLSRMGEGWFNGGSTKVKACFDPHPEIPGRLVNLRLLEERAKQEEWRTKSRIGGKKSGESRKKQSGKGKREDVKPSESTSKQSVEETKGGSTTLEAETGRVVEPKANSSVFSLQSSCISSIETIEEMASRGKPRSPRRPSVCDEEFLEELQRKPAYRALNVQALFQKMVVWCQVRGKQPTRARLVNWLNREDPPMATNGAHGLGRETATHYADGREKPDGLKGFVC